MTRTRRQWQEAAGLRTFTYAVRDRDGWHVTECQIGTRPSDVAYRSRPVRWWHPTDLRLVVGDRWLWFTAWRDLRKVGRR